MTEFTKIAGVETPIEVAKLINALVDAKGNIDLDNLSATGEAKFTNLATKINTVQENVNALTTTVNEKIGATVSKAQNGYIKFTNGVIIAWGFFNNANNAQTFTFPIYANWKVIVCSDVGTGCLSYGISPTSNTEFIFHTTDRNVSFRFIAIAGTNW